MESGGQRYAGEADAGLGARVGELEAQVVVLTGGCPHVPSAADEPRLAVPGLT